MVSAERVQFRFVGAPGARVEVVGDLPTWRTAHVLEERAPGEHALELMVAPGVHRYRFRVDGAWVSDPRAQLVDTTEGYHNAVLVVGGLAGPLVFSADRRHVQRGDDGALLVHAELVGDGPLPRVWARVGEQTREATMVEVLRRHDRRLLRAALQLPRGAGSFGFSVAPGRSFLLPDERRAEERAPAWLQGATLYGVFVDRWHRGRDSAPDPRQCARTTPSTPSTYYGGDLEGLRADLPQLAALGIDAVVLTPVHRAESAHRYDAIDILQVDPLLGGERALRHLCDDAHALGLRVIVDLSVTHVSDRHPAFRDVLEHQQASAFAPWFRVRAFPVRRRDGTTFEHYYDAPNLPWLNLESASPARAHALDAAARLIELGADGLRLDAMDDAPDSFWRALRRRVRAIDDDAVLLGEIVSDDLARRAEGGGVDLATDFRVRDALLGFFARRTLDAAGLVDALAFARHRTGAFPASFRLAFLDNHDTSRFLSTCRSPANLRGALAALCLLDETLWLTYGTEAELCTEHAEAPLDGAWPDRLPMPACASVDTPTSRLLRRLLLARRRTTARAVVVEEAQGDRLVLARPGAAGVRVVVERDREPAIEELG